MPQRFVGTARRSLPSTTASCLCLGSTFLFVHGNKQSAEPILLLAVHKITRLPAIRCRSNAFSFASATWHNLWRISGGRIRGPCPPNIPRPLVAILLCTSSASQFSAPKASRPNLASPTLQSRSTSAHNPGPALTKWVHYATISALCQNSKPTAHCTKSRELGGAPPPS